MLLRPSGDGDDEEEEEEDDDDDDDSSYANTSYINRKTEGILLPVVETQTKCIYSTFLPANPPLIRVNIPYARNTDPGRLVPHKRYDSPSLRLR